MKKKLGRIFADGYLGLVIAFMYLPIFLIIVFSFSGSSRYFYQRSSIGKFAFGVKVYLDFGGFGKHYFHNLGYVCHYRNLLFKQESKKDNAYGKPTADDKQRSGNGCIAYGVFCRVQFCFSARTYPFDNKPRSVLYSVRGAFDTTEASKNGPEYV